MSDLYQQFLAYAVATWRRRWYAIGVAWLVCGLGWTFVASLPDRYESSARIYADMDSMLGPLMQGLAVEMNMFRQLDIMQRTLLSRPNLEKVVLQTDLDLTVTSEAEKEKLLDRLARDIELRQQGTNLFTVNYTDKDPQLSKRVVQAVLQIFVEGNLGRSRKDMDTAERFLAGQIQDYERQLQQAEARRAEFKRRNMGFLPGEGRDYYTQMQLVRANVAKTETLIGQARSSAQKLREQLKNVPQFLDLPGDGGSAVAAGLGGGPESDLQVRILEIDRLVDNLLTRYTEKHPDVINARRRIEVLKGQLAEEKRREAEFAGNGSGSEQTRRNQVSNPVYEKLKFELVQREAAVAALEERRRAQKAEVEKWTKMAKLVPQVEAQLTRLDRDYEIIKKGYAELRSRQESARLARNLETKANKVQFRIIDPPKVPILPVGPNRGLFASIVLFAGLAAGLGFAFLLSQLNATFSSVQSLRSAFVLPVVGSISAIRSAAESRRNRREMVGFGMASVSLFLAFAALQAVGSMADGSMSNLVRGVAQTIL